jgi:Ca-activated chloride channel homolog
MLALPLLPALNLWLLRRPGKPALIYSSLGVVREAADPQWRRQPAAGADLPGPGPGAPG